MGDPLSALAGVAGLLDISVRTAGALRDVSSELRHAPAIILALLNETSDIAVVLNRVADAKQALEGLDTEERLDVLAALQRELDRARAVLGQIEHLTNEIRQAGNATGRVQWLLKKTIVNRLKDELREIRVRINELLVAHTTSASARVELELRALRIDLQRHRENIFEHLESKLQNTEASLSLLETAAEREPHLSAQVLSVEHATATNARALASLQVDETQRFDTIHDLLRTILDEIGSEEERQRPRVEFLGPRTSVARSTHQSSVADSSPALYLSLQPRRSLCLIGCPCSCHGGAAIGGASLRLPRLLKQTLGSLFVGYAASMGSFADCDFPQCTGSRTVRFRAIYGFPIWFMKRALQADLELSTSGSLRFALTPRRRLDPMVGSPLHTAISRDTSTTVRLLESGAVSVHDVDYPDGRSALHLILAERTPNMDIVRVLLQHGADPDLENDDGMTPRAISTRMLLMRNMPDKQHSQMEELLPPSQALDQFDFTFIHKVVVGICPVDLDRTLQSRDLDLLKQVNARDHFGHTPLMYAAGLGDVAAIQTLIRAGASVNDRTGIGLTPLVFALRSKANSETCVRILVDAKADVNAMDAVGVTAFQRAAWKSSVAVCRIMISGGAYINFRAPEHGYTALMLAARVNQLETLRFLHGQGAELDEVDNSGTTALGHAILTHSGEAVSVLLHLGANYGHARNDGSTILHMIARDGDAETARRLAEFDPRALDIHAKDKAGFTATEVFTERDSDSHALVSAFYHLLQVADGDKSDMGSDFDDGGEVFEDAVEYLTI